MYLKNILSNVQRFSPDKSYYFRVRFPDIDTGYTYSGKGSAGPGYDPCPYQTWFPAADCNVPVGWFVRSKQMDFYMIDVPVPIGIYFSKIQLTFYTDTKKRLESWLERWYETLSNGGKHMGTLKEVARPLQIIKTYSNPNQALNRLDEERGFNFNTYYVVPDGVLIDNLTYRSNNAKTYSMEFNVVGKFADERVLKYNANQSE